MTNKNSNRIRSSLILKVAFVMLIICITNNLVFAEQTEASSLADNFSKVTLGMTYEKTIKLFGEPDEVFRGSKDNQSILTWKEGFRPFARNHVIILFENNKVTRATHSKGNIKDIDHYLEETFNEIDPIVQNGLDNSNNEFDLRFIFERMQKEKVYVSIMDDRIIEAFDNVQIGMSQEQLISQLGKPEKQSPHTIRWQINDYELMVKLFDGKAVSKKLDNGKLLVEVEENSWIAEKDGLSISVTHQD